MQKTMIFGTALLALAATGCSRAMAPTPTPSPTPTPVKSIYAFEECPNGAPSGNEGVINIIVPNSFDGNHIHRSVNTLKGPGFDEKEPASKPSGAHDSGVTPAPNGSVAPFNVEMLKTQFPKTDPYSTSGYALVRVIIMNGNNGGGPDKTRWTFLEMGDFHGVGLKDPADGDILCHNFSTYDPGTNKPTDANQIAYFYLNLNGLKNKPNDYKAHFEIGLVAPDADHTPIIIDPIIDTW